MPMLVTIVVVMMTAGEVNVSANRMSVRLNDTSPCVGMRQSWSQHEKGNQQE